MSLNHPVVKGLIHGRERDPKPLKVESRRLRRKVGEQLPGVDPQRSGQRDDVLKTRRLPASLEIPDPTLPGAASLRR